MSNWIIYALLAAVSASFVTVFSKLGVSSLPASLATSVRAIIMAVFLVIVSLSRGDFSNMQQLLSQRNNLLFLVFSGVAGAMLWLFLNMALKEGKAWQVAPIDKLSVVLTVIISVLIFKEEITTKGIIGVCFIALGSILVALA